MKTFIAIISIFFLFSCSNQNKKVIKRLLVTCNNQIPSGTVEAIHYEIPNDVSKCDSITIIKYHADDYYWTYDKFHTGLTNIIRVRAKVDSVIYE